MRASPETYEMTPVQRLALACTDVFVKAVPVSALRSIALSLSRHRPEALTSTITTYDRSFDSDKLPAEVREFSDLTFLFWLTPMNRGVLRQDFDETAILFQIIRELAPRRGVEIGRYSGGSTVLLAAAMTEPGAKLVSIDSAPVADTELTKVVSRLGLQDRVELIESDSAEVDVDDELDFVFIDGDHSYEGAKRDHLQWGRQVRKNGIIAHHDMARTRPHATSRTDLFRLRSDILEYQSSELELIHEKGSMAVFRKISDEWKSF